jgi:hypothetical protein
MTPLNKTRQLTNGVFLLILLSTGIAWSQSGKVLADSLGMQCGSNDGCPAQLPNGPGVPGLLRLWDSEVGWSGLNPNCSNPPCTNWNWTILDEYLDAVVADSSISAVVYTFGWVPCWDANTCSDPQNHRTSAPPKDLPLNCRPLGSLACASPTFDVFVDALTKHCTTEAHPVCVKDVIKYYEMWNEANDANQTWWSGTQSQLYQMVAPAVTNFIENNVSGAKILTPSVNPSSGFSTWQQNWLNLEDNNTRISNIYNFHVYLNTGAPETRWNIVSQMLAARNNTLNWKTTPWWNDETNFIPNNYTCSSSFSSADCTGQIARWQLLHASNGGTNLSWYKWKSTMAENSAYGLAYQYIMQYLVDGGGGSFSQPCSPNNLTPATWTCPFTEGDGTPALFVWTPSENTITSTVPAGYVDYRDLRGNTTRVTAGDPLLITVEPIMLEK